MPNYLKIKKLEVPMWAYSTSHRLRGILDNVEKAKELKIDPKYVTSH